MFVAERLPIAFKALEKATGLSGTALEKAMKDGKLLAEDVLPKLGRVMREMANQNDALNKSLQTTRVAQNRFTTAFQKFQNAIFKSGFGKSLTDMFNSFSEALGDLEGIGKVIGGIFHVVVKVVTSALKVLLIPLRTMSDLFLGLNEMMEDYEETVGSRLIFTLGGLALALQVVNNKLAVMFAKFTAIMAIVNEFIALSSKNVTGIIERRVLGRDVGSLSEAFGAGANLATPSKKEFEKLSTFDQINQGGRAMFLKLFSSITGDGGEGKPTVVLNNPTFTVADLPEFHSEMMNTAKVNN